MADPLLVVAAALVARDGRILVQRRPAGKAHGGLWEFPGGKVEAGETPEAALTRELREELAIAVAPAAMAPIGFATEEADGRPVLLLLFAAEEWTGKPQPLAAEALAWRTIGDLTTLPMPPADRPLVAALARVLEARAGIEPACKDLQSSA